MALDPTKAHVVATWKLERPLNTCRFDPTGKYVFSGGEESTLQRVLVADGTRKPFPGGHESWIFAIGFSKDGSQVISGGGDGRLVWWETASEDPKPIRKVEAHKGWIRSISVNPDGTLLASGGNDAVVRIWNIADGMLVREFPGHARDVYSVYFHPDGTSLFSGDLMGVIKQWDTSTGKEMGSYDAKELHSFNGGQLVDFGGVRGMAVSPDRKVLAAGGLYKATNPLGAVHEPLVQLFKTDSRELIKSQITDGITGGVLWRLIYLPDGILMGVDGGSTGGFLLFWKPGEDKDFTRFKLPNIARDMDIHPDGIQVVTAHYDSNLRITRLAE